MKRLALLSLSLLLLALALPSASVEAQTCSCPWQVGQGTNTGASTCEMGHQYNYNNMRSWAYWQCGNQTPCTTVYTPLSCTTDGSSTVSATGLINYKCC